MFKDLQISRYRTQGVAIDDTVDSRLTTASSDQYTAFAALGGHKNGHSPAVKFTNFRIPTLRADINDAKTATQILTATKPRTIASLDPCDVTVPHHCHSIC